MKTTITKRYSRKLSYNFQSEEFTTEETREVDAATKDDYVAAHDKLAKAVKSLTIKDAEKHSQLLKEAVADGKAIMTEEKTL